MSVYVCVYVLYIYISLATRDGMSIHKSIHHISFHNYLFMSAHFTLFVFSTSRR